jgi:hypothetical protein
VAQVTPAHIEAAAQLYASRRARDEMFGTDRDGFGEPGWDMLLALVAWGSMTSIDLADKASGPNAETYIAWLRSRRLIVRAGDTVSLGDRGRTLMLAYLDTEIGVPT